MRVADMEAQKNTTAGKDSAKEKKDTVTGCFIMLVIAGLIVLGIRDCMGGGGGEKQVQAPAPQAQVEKPEPRPVAYSISPQGEAAPVMATDLPTPSVDESVTADVTVDKSYLALGKRQYRVLIRATNNDRWRQFDGKVALLMRIPGMTIDIPIGVNVPPMSTVATDYWASPQSGEVSGYRVEGSFKLVWPELEPGVPPFEVVAFNPGIQYTRAYIVTGARGEDLKAIVEVFREVYDATYDSYKAGLNGFELNFYPPELRKAAEAKDWAKAKAAYDCNFKSGLSSFRGSEDWVPREREITGYRYDAQTGEEIPIYADE